MVIVNFTDIECDSLADAEALARVMRLILRRGREAALLASVEPPVKLAAELAPADSAFRVRPRRISIRIS